jgi:hypothetical protein
MHLKPLWLSSVASIDRADRSPSKKRNQLRCMTFWRRITRGEMSRRRAIPARGIHRRAVGNLRTPRGKDPPTLVYAIPGWVVRKTKSSSLVWMGETVPPASPDVQKRSQNVDNDHELRVAGGAPGESTLNVPWQLVTLIESAGLGARSWCFDVASRAYWMTAGKCRKKR